MIYGVNNSNNEALRRYQEQLYEYRANQNAQKGNNPFGNGSNNDIEWVSSNKKTSQKNLNETVKAIKDSQNKNTAKSKGAETSEKTAHGQAASVLGQQAFYQATFARGSIWSKATKVTPFTIASAALGVDFEEDGAALKRGAVTGKGGNYKEGYKKLFSKIDKTLDKCVKEGGLKNVLNSFGQILSALPNMGSTAITNTLQYIGAGLSKIGAQKLAKTIGASVELVGTVLNSIGQGVVSSAKNLGGALLSLVKGKPSDALKHLKKLGNDFKKMGIKIKDKVLDALNSGKELVVKAGKVIVKGAKIVGNAVKTGAKAAWNGTKQVAKTVWKGVQKGWKKFKNFFRRRR